MPTIYLRFPSVTFTSPASRYPPLLTAGLWLVGFGAVLWLAGALTLGHWGAAALAAGLLALLLVAPVALVLPVTHQPGCSASRYCGRVKRRFHRTAVTNGSGRQVLGS